jgi:hypothetical protein
MTSDRDIYRAANVLIVQLGEAAPTHAEICHRQLLADGDLSGVAFWERIIGAIDVLLRYEHTEAATVH